VTTETFSMQSNQRKEKPWLTENFAERFREAFGREMTAEERDFFGLDSRVAEDDHSENAERSP
jgi:hypothetical protein